MTGCCGLGHSSQGDCSVCAATHSKGTGIERKLAAAPAPSGFSALAKGVSFRGQCSRAAACAVRARRGRTATPAGAGRAALHRRHSVAPTCAARGCQRRDRGTQRARSRDSVAPCHCPCHRCSTCRRSSGCCATRCCSSRRRPSPHGTSRRAAPQNAACHTTAVAPHPPPPPPMCVRRSPGSPSDGLESVCVLSSARLTCRSPSRA